MHDNLHQYDGWSKASIHMISEAKLFRVLVREYLPPTIGSELLLSYKLVWVIGRHFITQVSLEYNNRMISKYRPITETIVSCGEYGYDDIYKELIKSLCQGINERQKSDKNAKFNQKKESDDNNS